MVTQLCQGDLRLRRFQRFTLFTAALAVVCSTAQVASAQTQTGSAPGAVMFSDALDDPSHGIFPPSSPNEAQYHRGYGDGEYVIQKVDASLTGMPLAAARPEFADGVVSVDARVGDDNTDVWMYVACRSRPDGPFGAYYLGVDPGAGTFSFGRWDSADAAGAAVFVPQGSTAPSIQGGGASNTLALSCVGSKIAASVNGAEVGAVSDTHYAQGRAFLGAWGDGVTADVRFTNFAVHSASAPSADALAGTAATPAPLAGQVLYRDNFDDPAATRLPVAQDPRGGVYAIVDGEYQLSKTSPTADVAPIVRLSGAYGDTSTDVDVRMVDPAETQTAVVGCRVADDSLNGYWLALRRDTQQFHLTRIAGTTSAELVPWTPAPSVVRNGPTHVELICIGSTISVIFGETVVAAVKDSTYSAGHPLLAAGSAVGKPLDVRFAKLVITQR
jgi:hypothetical protein